MCSGVLTLPVNNNYIIHVFACLIKYSFFLDCTIDFDHYPYSFLWESVDAYDMLRLAVLLHMEP